MHDHPDFPSVIGGRCTHFTEQTCSLCHAVALQRQRQQTCTTRLNVFLQNFQTVSSTLIIILLHFVTTIKMFAL